MIVVIRDKMTLKVTRMDYYCASCWVEEGTDIQKPVENWFPTCVYRYGLGPEIEGDGMVEYPGIDLECDTVGCKFVGDMVTMRVVEEKYVSWGMEMSNIFYKCSTCWKKLRNAKRNRARKARRSKARKAQRARK